MADATPELPEPYFHTDSQTFRFWVPMEGQPPMGASIAKQVLHHRFQGKADGSDAESVYATHRATIDAAVLRRAASGSREPVMLREHDLPLPPR